MHLLTRPSKSFLFDYLKNLLANEKGDVGIDAAAERIRNRHMFKTKSYYGIDQNKEALMRGLKSNPGDSVYAIEADMTNLEKIPEGSADVVLSSNTLYQIPVPLREKAVQELCRITTPHGVCILEFTKDQDFPEMLSIVRAHFSDIKLVYFKNPVSRMYEKYAYSNPPHERKLFATLPLRCVAWLISRLEYLTKSKDILNTHVLVIARAKIGNSKKNTFTLAPFRKLGERIYSAL